MCIVILTTAHPDYALIVIDNRDEFILRPTSRPHWWKSRPDVDVLSSRDLQREEKGTWLGITRGGNFAVLTNYKETDTADALHPICGKRSRGGMVTAWLGAHPTQSTADFARTMLESGDVRGVGGFSLICGKLRKRKGSRELEPLAIISNRSDNMDQIHWICGARGETLGLSNTHHVERSLNEPGSVPLWPKVRQGEEMVREVIAAAIAEDATNDDNAANGEPKSQKDDCDRAQNGVHSENPGVVTNDPHQSENSKSSKEARLIDSLFHILDQNRLPQHPGMSFDDTIPFLKESIFIPPIGDESHKKEMPSSSRESKDDCAVNGAATEDLAGTQRPDEQTTGFMRGMYGTQRQTVLLVDWNGEVTYVERALWDEEGYPLGRDLSDVTHKFMITGWEL